MLKTRKDKIIAVIVNGLFFLAALACFFQAYYLGHMLDSQFEAERWQGDGNTEFSQISCFMVADEKLQVSDINSFRMKMVKKLEDASHDLSQGIPFTDCWSCEGSAKVYGAYSGTASIIACGGNFFEFHPLKLVTGNYFSGSDLMQDNVLLDEDLAWLLFGGNDLEGQFVYIFNTPFRVAGVVAREGDQATDKAYSGGLGLFMSYDAYYDLTDQAAEESGSYASSPVSSVPSGDDGTGTVTGLVPPGNVGITCYEVCMPNPVDGFARGVVEADFPIGRGDIVENTGRFGFFKILSIMKDFSLRSIHDGAAYSYWENAARYAENKIGIYYVAFALCILNPLIIFLVIFFRSVAWTNRSIRENVIPAASERAEEAIRRRQRRRWEKKHPNQY